MDAAQAAVMLRLAQVTLPRLSAAMAGSARQGSGWHSRRSGSMPPPPQPANGAGRRSHKQLRDPAKLQGSSSASVQVQVWYLGWCGE